MTKPKKKSSKLARIVKVVLAIVCVILVFWGYTSWRSDMQAKRKKTELAANHKAAILHAVQYATPLNVVAKLGRFSAKVSDVKIRPDLLDSENHKYIIASFEINNTLKQPTNYRVICKGLDGLRNYYTTAVLDDGTDITDAATVSKIAADPVLNKDIRQGTLAPGKTIKFELVSDVEGSSGPYLMMCEANQHDNTVTAWKLS